MNKEMFSGMLLTLLLIGMVILAFNIQPVKADGTIYIRADGSIDPPTANITTSDNITYTFTDNINDSIVLERDNIVLDGAGHTVQGTGSGNGITLIIRNNVTIKNMEIKEFWRGIELYESSNITVSGNIIKSHSHEGISLWNSTDNIISGNRITNNTNYGIRLTQGAHDNTISDNYIAQIFVDIRMSTYSFNNSIYHNNFMGTTVHVHTGDNFIVAGSWDNGYPSGGNYWNCTAYDCYDGTDLYRGPYQNETGSDGIGDTPYITYYGDNVDRYPLMKPYPWDSHDVGITSVVTSKSVVGQGFELDTSVTLFNYGNNTETFNVTAYCDENAITLPDGKNQTTIVLTSLNSTTITFIWNTTNVAKGNYTISAVADIVLGETETGDNSLTDGWVFVTIPGDINADKTVDIFDAVTFSNAFDNPPGDPGWNPNADINGDLTIDIFDAIILANNFDETWV